MFGSRHPDTRFCRMKSSNVDIGDDHITTGKKAQHLIGNRRAGHNSCPECRASASHCHPPHTFRISTVSIRKCPPPMPGLCSDPHRPHQEILDPTRNQSWVWSSVLSVIDSKRKCSAPNSQPHLIYSSTTYVTCYNFLVLIDKIFTSLTSVPPSSLTSGYACVTVSDNYAPKLIACTGGPRRRSVRILSLTG